MKKRNKRGFILAETIVVSVVTLSALIFIYTQFININRSYQNSFRYNTVDKLYDTKNVLDFLKTSGLERIIDNMTSQYIDITSCPSYISESLYCQNLMSKLNIKQVIFTSEDTTELKKILKNEDNLSEEMKKFIKVLSINKEIERYRIIVEFNDNTFASLKTEKMNIPEISFTYQDFDYTGSVQEFTAPATGNYKLEVWGAQGGNVSTKVGGKGGYSKGVISLTQNQKLYIYVGGSGSTVSSLGCLDGGWNGGGGTCGPSINQIATGGGATDIATSNQTISVNIYGSPTRSNYQDILIVAGGGGGATSNSNGGSGGGTVGIDGDKKTTYGYGTGGTQSSGGGSYNVGSNNNTCYYVTTQSCNATIGAIQTCQSTGTNSNNTGSCSWKGEQGYGGGYKMTSTSYSMGNHHSSAGGGGYYGGGIGGTAYVGGGGGGSGYVGSLKESQTIAGNASLPTHDGTNTMIGNDGNGFAKITLIK